MVVWHHQLNGHEFEQTLGDSEGQGSLTCCSPWGCRVRHRTMNNNRNQLEYLQEIQMHSPTLEVEDEGCWVGRSGSRVVTFSWCLRGIQHIQLSLGSSKSRPYTSVVWGSDPRDWEDMEDRREVTP